MRPTPAYGKLPTMKTITIQQLQDDAPRWVHAAETGRILIEENGRVVAEIVPQHTPPAPKKVTWPDREAWINSQPRTSDSAAIISEMRDRA